MNVSIKERCCDSKNGSSTGVGEWIFSTFWKGFVNLGKSDDGCAATNTEVLIIEEIGQLANKVFEAVESICRFARGNGFRLNEL